MCMKQWFVICLFIYLCFSCAKSETTQMKLKWTELLHFKTQMIRCWGHKTGFERVVDVLKCRHGEYCAKYESPPTEDVLIACVLLLILSAVQTQRSHDEISCSVSPCEHPCPSSLSGWSARSYMKSHACVTCHVPQRGQDLKDLISKVSDVIYHSSHTMSAHTRLLLQFYLLEPKYFSSNLAESGI